MSKLLYLLGAGASASCIPVVSGISEELTALSKMRFEASLHKGGEYKYTSFGELLSKEFINDCEWLGKNGQDHRTIDIFAKKLYLKQEYENLKKLKRVLSFYLLFKQMQNIHDVRYDIFLTTIMKLKEDKIFIPEEIIIGTWNYDNQILIALLKILGLFEPNAALQYINIQPWHDRKIPKDGIPKLFHSNGLAGFASSPHGTKDFYYLLNKRFNRESAVEFNEAYKQVSEDPNTVFTINFAWEDVGQIQTVRNAFFRTIAEIEILIVIGYSFPTFNREYDKRIFKEAKSLKKIYIQDKVPDERIERVQSLIEKDLQIIPVGDTEQFYIPVELSI